jgi:DNA polymerase kappa
MAFFGFRQSTGQAADSPEAGRVGESPYDDDGWEKLPDDFGFDSEAADQAASEEPETAPARSHGKEITPNPKRAQEPPPEQWWDCPICSRPQPAEERQFNDHIDLCLSRQTIREAVQADGVSECASPQAPEVKKPRSQERKRARTASAPDPKQKKLCFG